MILQSKFSDNKDYLVWLRVNLAIKTWNRDLLETLRALSKEEITDIHVNNSLKFYQGWFSDTLMHTENVKEELIGNDWDLRWYFDFIEMTHRSDEVDMFLEKILIDAWYSYEDIWMFLCSRPAKHFFHDLYEKNFIHPNEQITYINEFSSRLFKQIEMIKKGN